MISVGIDVAKGKSTVCIVRPFGEVLMKPKDFKHTQSELKVLADKMKMYDEEIHVIMEATGTYHLPIKSYLEEKNYDVRVINPLEMKRYRCQGIRNPKTDRIDSMIIAKYGIDNWYYQPKELEMEGERAELKFLGAQYFSIMKTKQDGMLKLYNIMERSLPGMYGVLDDFNKATGKDKQSDFVYDFYHLDMITKYSEKKFCEKYQAWTKKKGYLFSEKEAGQLYLIAKEGIPTIKPSENTKLVVREAVNILREVNASLYSILTQMTEIAKQLPEYDLVMSMKGIGSSLGPRLMAEIGDPRRFHSAKALIAYAGIDVDPYESGTFKGTERHMTKRGSKIMRKIGYEIMDAVNKHQKIYAGDPVCEYFLKKREEGKPYRVAMFAAYNKFLRIYHSRVSALLNETEA